MRMSMRLVGVSMVKNEVDIIEYFVRHNLNYLDALIITDNGSVDGTREILTRLKRDDGLPLAIIDDPEMKFLQSEKMTKMVFSADKYFHPDFIFALDADEFIVAQSRGYLETSLANLPPQTAGLLRWKTYVVLEDLQEKGKSLFERIRHRRVKESPEYHKVVIPKNFSDSPDNIVALGNHFVTNKNYRISHQFIPELAIAHFPVRSIRQLKLKILLGWLGYLAQKPKNDEGSCYHWKQLYDLILADQLSPETLSRVSKNYCQKSDILEEFNRNELIQEPIVSDITIKYQSIPRKDEVFTLIKSIEKKILKPFFLLEEKTSRLSIDWPPFHHICEKYASTSVLEINCNKGEYVKLFETAGVQYSRGVGMEPYDESMLCDRPSYYFYDRIDSLTTDNVFDLIVFTNNVKNFSREDLEKIVRFMAEYSARCIMFSFVPEDVTTSNNDGYPDPTYWIDLFQQLGWQINVFDSLICRSMASLPCFQRGLVIFEKSGSKLNFPELTVEDLLKTDAEQITRKQGDERPFSRSSRIIHKPKIRKGFLNEFRKYFQKNVTIRLQQ